MSATREDALEAAWRETCWRRERPELLGTAAITGSLQLVWAVFDALSERWIPAGLSLARIAVAALWGAAYVFHLRRGRLAGSRALTLAMGLVSGTTLAAVIAGAPDRVYFPYVLGFSLLVWGTAGVSWPVGYSASLSILNILQLVLFDRAAGKHGVAMLVGACFYLASAFFVSTLAVVVRWRLLRRLFVASSLLALANENLEHALGQLKETQARLIASEKQSALGRLLAGLSHEINNPVNVLRNNLEPLARYFETLLGLALTARAGDLSAVRERTRAADADAAREDARDALLSMQTAVERVQSVHQDLRAFVRGDAQRDTGTLGDLNEGVRTTVAMLRRNVPPGVALTLELGELPP